MPKLSAEDQQKLVAIKRWHRRKVAGGHVVRIMALVEGYVVARHKGCAPFLRHANDWLKEFEPADPLPWESLPGTMRPADRSEPTGDQQS